MSTQVVVSLDKQPTSREQFEGLIATDAGRLLYAEFGIRSWEDYQRVSTQMEARAKDLGVEIPEYAKFTGTSDGDLLRLHRSIEEASKEDAAAEDGEEEVEDEKSLLVKSVEDDADEWLKAAKLRSEAVERELRSSSWR